MAIYVIIYIIFIVFCFLSIKKVKLNDKIQNNLFWTLVLLCILSVGLRHYSVGTDSENYMYYFLRPIDGYNRGQSIEIGFKYWVEFIRLFTKDYEVFFFLSAIISIMPLAYCINILSTNKVVTFFFILFSTSVSTLFEFEFSGMRQAISIAFFSLGILSLIKRNICIKTILFFCISLLFHNSSILCIIIIMCMILIKKPISMRCGLFMIIGSLFIYNIFIEYFVTYIQILSSYLSDDIQILKYGASGIELYDRVKYLIMATPFSIMAICYLINNAEDKQEVFQNNYVTLIAVIINLFVAFPIGFRITLYFIPFFMVFCLNKFLNKKYYVIILICIACIFSYRYLATLNTQNLNRSLTGNIIVPYKSSVFN